MNTIRDDDRPKRSGCSPWLLGCLGVPLLLVVGCLALVGGGWYFAQHSIPRANAMVRAASNPEVREALGSPLRGHSLRGNNDLSVRAGRRLRMSSISLSIPVSGPKGEGTIHVEAEKHGRNWIYHRLDISLPGRSVPIDLRYPQERREAGAPAPPQNR